MFRHYFKRTSSHFITVNFRPQLKANFATDVFKSAFEIGNRSCWKCGCSNNPHIFFCTNCGKLQKVSFHKQLNLYNIFGIKSEFCIDLKELDKLFKSIQLKLHPDKFTTCTMAEQDASLSSSSSVNQAYQVVYCITVDAEQA
jgi:hypothetical protein